MRALVGATALGVVLLASQVAGACEGSVGLLRDNFDGDLARLWDSTEAMAANDGSLEITSRPEKAEKILADPKFVNADICADVVVSDAKDLSGAYAGLGFWFQDYRNLYTFQVTPDGYAGVYRLKDDKWETVLKDKKSSSIVTGLDSTNTVRVVIVGNKATLYINGDRFGSITGEPPEGGSHVGFVMEGAASEAVTFRYDNLDVTYPD